MEKFLINGMPAIRAWFFFISVAFGVLFELEYWGKILQWMVKLSQPFGKKVKFKQPLMPPMDGRMLPVKWR